MGLTSRNNVNILLKFSTSQWNGWHFYCQIKIKFFVKF